MFDGDFGGSAFKHASPCERPERTSIMTEVVEGKRTDLATAAPRRLAFKKKFTTVRLAPEAVERQSRITLLAWNLMGADAAIAFLNNHCSPLEGRPLDLAVRSAAGFEAVEQHLLQIAQRSSS